MRNQLWKPVLVGLAIGALVYYAPFFLFRGFFFFLIIAFVVRLFWFRRAGWWRYRDHHYGSFNSRNEVEL